MQIGLILLLTANPSRSVFLNAPLRPRDVSSPSDIDNLRTRQSIVWSCLATIAACTWVAIHPNLPSPRYSKWSQFKHRIAMMVLTIFAPEFILIWALRQRLGAHSIMKEYNSIVIGTDEEKASPYHDLRAWFHNPPPPNERRIWTLTHGFYVQMGGFLFHDKASEGPIRALSFPELLDLIKAGLVDPPTVTDVELCDKSKGDFFAKLFVVVQTTWFMVQCVVRWITKLPVTELEIMTFSFAVLNIITYALWFEKPQNVTVGTCIQMKDRTREPDNAVVHPNVASEVDITDSHRQAPEHSSPAFNGEPNWTADLDLRHRSPLSPISDGNRIAFTQTHGDAIQPDRSRRPAWKQVFVTISVLPNTLYLLGKAILRAQLFTQFRKVVLGCTPTMGARSIISTQNVKKQTYPETTIVSVMPGPLTLGAFHAHDTSGSNKKGRLILFVVASGLLFGGLHLIPWKFKFPTHIEAVIWRVSALYIMLNPVLLSFPLALFAFLLSRPPLRSDLRSAVIRRLRWVTPPIRIITVAIPLYILARLSIIVLAFTTLRSLDPDVYRDIPWSSYIPHI